MSMFAKVIEEIADAFTTFERDGYGKGTVAYKIKDDAPEWIKDFKFMHKIHHTIDDRGPDDWVYEHASRVADALHERELESSDDARDAVNEIADGLVDVYTMDRIRWLASNLHNVSLCDEAVAERGMPDNIADQIGAGQFLALERIAYAMIDAAEDEACNREEEE